MHSIHRELEIKHKRLQTDVGVAQTLIGKQEVVMRDQGIELMAIKTVRAEQDSKI